MMIARHGGVRSVTNLCKCLQTTNKTAARQIPVDRIDFVSAARQSQADGMP